jgi:hypothetical protein
LSTLFFLELIDLYQYLMGIESIVLFISRILEKGTCDFGDFAAVEEPGLGDWADLDLGEIADLGADDARHDEVAAEGVEEGNWGVMALVSAVEDCEQRAGIVDDCFYAAWVPKLEVRRYSSARSARSSGPLPTAVKDRRCLVGLASTVGTPDFTGIGSPSIDSMTT